MTDSPLPNPAAAAVLALAATLLVLLPPAAPARAQPPTLEESVGHASGERITLHHEMVRYLHALAETSDRVRVVEQGRSWEGRELPVAVVTSPANHARLDEIRATSARLADPRAVEPAELDGLLADQPVVVWLGGSIHGFELSGAEGTLKLLERLATADDPETLRVLDQAVVLIDPMLNPDGREAFAQTNHRRAGTTPNPRPEHWANDYDRWQALAFRTGHYYFDTNRDWFAHTQAETRARVPTLLAWKPQVMVDLHEMGRDAEFFFDPPAPPYGPSFPELARAWFPRFGRAYAEAFDRAGFEYMTGERFNYFYPGYTSSFGSYQGAVSMLFEQSSSRGFALERPDGSVRTLADATEQHATAAWTAVRTAAAEREELLREFHGAHRSEMAEGRRGVRRYLIERPAPGDGSPSRVAEMVGMLLDNGIEVGRLTGEARLRGVTDRIGGSSGERTFPPGTFVVEAAQPRNRLVRALLAPAQPLPDEFLEAARERLDRGENPRFYDITAWSLPLLFDVDAYGSTDGAALPIEAVTAEGLSPKAPADQAPPERAGYAYLLDGTDAASMAVLYHLRHRGVRASVLTEATVLGGEPVASGTVVVRARQAGRAGGASEEEVHRTVAELAAGFGVAVRPVDTGLADPDAEGVTALGTGKSIAARPVAVALLAGGPVDAYSFGWAWYTLDRRYRIPATVIQTSSVAGTPLADFDTLVLPDLVSAEALADELGEAGVERLSGWVRDGGTLVAVGDAVDFVREGLGLTALRSWYDENTPESDEDPPEEAPERYAVPGAFLRGEVDPRVWLAAGVATGDPDRELPVLVDSARIVLAPEGPPSAERRVAVRYAASGPEGGGALLLSGHAWPESLERLAGAVFAYDERIGRGRVTVFAEDPCFRGYWRGADRLFVNAVVLGPSAP